MSRLAELIRLRRMELWRKDGRMTLREVARRAGMSASFLSRVESGRERVSEEKAASLAAVLGLDLDVLLAADGRVSSRLQAIVARRPELFSKMLRALESAPDHALEGIAERVRDGDW